MNVHEFQQPTFSKNVFFFLNLNIYSAPNIFNKTFNIYIHIYLNKNYKQTNENNNKQTIYFLVTVFKAKIQTTKQKYLTAALFHYKKYIKLNVPYMNLQNILRTRYLFYLHYLHSHHHTMETI